MFTSMILCYLHFCICTVIQHSGPCSSKAECKRYSETSKFTSQCLHVYLKVCEHLIIYVLVSIYSSIHWLLVLHKHGLAADVITSIHYGN